ncbi:hypothetical protein O7602_26720 [Micromonospora sp. WMMD1128]|uniref:hypothetical protein n=1 Tax=Micromonospora sp. WMMD1128 TaxID=3015150 RepID=UPI00248B892C|nr:hypothetical protein [Micromonospora sp. WMMD1128]WBB73238.1 hypothetical protein O7602_26720 [Micromonospora sp. WMMD1128]
MAVSYVGATSDTSVTTASSFPTSFPAGWAAGDLVILAGHVSGTNLTMNPGAGWDPVDGLTNPIDQGANSRLYLWQRRLQAGDSAPTISGSGAITGGWEMVILRDAAASPVGQVGASSTASSTSLALSPLTGVSAGSALVGIAHTRVASGTLPSGIDWDPAYTEVTDISTSRATSAANVRNSAAYRLISSAGSYGGETVAVNNSVSASMVGVLVEVLQGAAVVDGGGSLAAAGAVSVDAVVGQSGGGSLSAGAAVSVSSTVLASAVGALPASGVLSAAGVVRVPRGGSLAAAGAVSAAGQVRVPGGAVLAAGGSLTASGSAQALVGGALAAAGALAAVGVVVVRGAASLSAAGALGAAGARVAPGSALVAASSALSAPGVVLAAGGASIAADGSLAGPGVVVLLASAGLDAGADLVAASARGGPVVRPYAGVVSRPLAVVSRPSSGVVVRP